MNSWRGLGMVKCGSDITLYSILSVFLCSSLSVCMAVCLYVSMYLPFVVYSRGQTGHLKICWCSFYSFRCVGCTWNPANEINLHTNSLFLSCSLSIISISIRFTVSFSLSFCISIRVSVSFSVFLSLSLFIWHFPVDLSVSIRIAVSFSVSLCVSFSLFFSAFVRFLSLCLFICFFLCLYPYLCTNRLLSLPYYQSHYCNLEFIRFYTAHPRRALTLVSLRELIMNRVMK